MIAFVYSLWLVYAADPKYVLLGALATFPNIIPYVWYRHHLRRRIFTIYEWGVVVLLLVGAIIAAWGLAAGTITL